MTTGNYPNYLQMHCSRCKIADDCPSKGASPLQLNRTPKFCSIIGGYGTKPVDRNKLSPENQIRFDNGNQYISIAEVPVKEGNLIYTKLIKIMHKPIKHPREVIDDITVMMYPKSYKD